MNRLQDEMNRVFDRWGTGRTGAGRGVFPALNLWEDEQSIYVEAELPGLALDDVEIYVTGNNQLNVTGERKEPSHDKGTWHRQERGHGKFSRTIELPHDVDAEKVTAEFKHGVLTITLPKREEVKPRRIEVKAT
jgi:HSP20 family protein